MTGHEALVKRLARQLWPDIRNGDAEEGVRRFLAALDLPGLLKAEREAERAAWQKWLNETRIAVAEQSFDVETAIMCGGKKPTLHDAGQVGFAAGLFAWEAAIRAREQDDER